MTERLNTTLKAAVLGGLALMFYSKISAGTLGYYINQRFFWLPYVAMLLLMGLAMTMVHQTARARTLAANALQADAAAMSPEHTHRQPWWVLATVALPVVLGLAFPARPLGASALDARGISGGAPARVATLGAVAASEEGKTILDWLRDFQKAGDPQKLAGQTADVIGFVYHDSRTAADQFWVARYTISCCVADASGIGMVVRYPGAAQLEEGDWVRVSGTFSVGERDGAKIPVLVAAAVTATDMPAQPYLVP